jgi:hypothetical protein
VRHLRIGFATLAVALGLFVFSGQFWHSGAAAQRAQQPEKNNMELVGSHDLQARSAYQPLIHKQGDRWIAYIGHHGGQVANPLTGQDEHNGTSILDVTNPKQPKYLAHIPGEAGLAEAGGAQMVRVCNGTA